MFVYKKIIKGVDLKAMPTSIFLDDNDDDDDDSGHAPAGVASCHCGAAQNLYFLSPSYVVYA